MEARQAGEQDNEEDTDRDDSGDKIPPPELVKSEAKTISIPREQARLTKLSVVRTQAPAKFTFCDHGTIRNLVL